jgi:hypothetical protein
MTDVEVKIGEFHCPNCRRRKGWWTDERPNCWHCLVEMVPWWSEAFRFECWGIAATDPEWALEFNRSCDGLRPVGVYPKVESGNPRFRCLHCEAVDYTSDEPPFCRECHEFMWYAPDPDPTQDDDDTGRGLDWGGWP